MDTLRTKIRTYLISNLHMNLNDSAQVSKDIMDIIKHDPTYEKVNFEEI